MHPTLMAVLAVERQRVLREEAARERLAHPARALRGMGARSSRTGGPLARLRVALTPGRRAADPATGA